MIKSQLIEFASKYLVVYVDRILRIIITELNKYEGNEHNNPYFSEHFLYLNQDDSFFKRRTTFSL